MKTLLNSIRIRFLRVLDFPFWVIRNVLFYSQYQHLESTKKIIYALTPPPYLKNIGDHAQAVAIQAWFKKHFPSLEVIELDKDQSRYFLPAIKQLLTSEDIVFLHSGGNLGDRGLWSERIRRRLIKNLKSNKVISLPQTIFFSDTENGRVQQEITEKVYQSHPDLVVFGRDPYSGELAQALFPNAQTYCMPDFVLSLPPKGTTAKNASPKILLCLRLDHESALSEAQRQSVESLLPYACTYYDTTLDAPIPIEKRETILAETLQLFLQHDVVITDRYHGLIFTILCQKPCIVLRTVDHKLTSARYWFKEMPSVVFAEDLSQLPTLVSHCLQNRDHYVPDWNASYFDQIPSLVGLTSNEKPTSMAAQ
ncbi:polysaccharide pyruvyl transferase family protein [Acaryochloris sp. IP29b_bin.137]|uniref:polysaccharide pyruvyl transferase family protein n=1 Tax=Acaryochloris sp. IP29b_bin.137 TaxID=2969217 RepID=UPI0026333989|nr:polysaccharide pyruvyl transferase family protein [Acaryochloris sp. IP29b_bin.137]